MENYQQKIERLDEELAPYHEAQSMVPDDALIYRFKDEYEKAHEAFVEAEKRFKGSVARKSSVYGYSHIGKDFGVSAQTLRAWHQNFCPDAPYVYDLKKTNDKKRERLGKRNES